MTDANRAQDPTRSSRSQQLWSVIKSPTFVGLIIFFGSLIGTGFLIWGVVSRLSTGLGLPALALFSVLLLLAALLVFTTLIHLIGLSDPMSALGLPDGSVRALLALALLGLFAILASSVLVTPPSREVKGIRADEISALVQFNPNEHDIVWTPEKRDNPAQPLTFTATFNSTTHVDDFGKQMLTLVGTLMTAVISFYFGSATTASATATATGTGGASVTTAAANPNAISPTTAKMGTPQTYTITGTGLAGVTKVEALPLAGGPAVAATLSSKTDTEVKFDLSLPGVGAWMLRLTSGTNVPVSVPGAIEAMASATGSGGASVTTTAANPSAISPTTAKTGTPQPYTVTGTGLAGVTKVEAVPPSGGPSVAATLSSKTETEVKFDLSLPAVGAWTLEITSGTTAPVSVPGTIEVTDA